jgi:hypothetical protein
MTADRVVDHPHHARERTGWHEVRIEQVFEPLGQAEEGKQAGGRPHMETARR